jgi:putative nucleotidyltransferase with HDIG domain
MASGARLMARPWGVVEATMTQPAHAVNPWQETFRLLTNVTAPQEVDWHRLARQALDALTALPQCVAAAVWLWHPPLPPVARVTAPDRHTAHDIAQRLWEALRQVPGAAPPLPDDPPPALSVALDAGRPIDGIRTLPLQGRDVTAGALVIATTPVAEPLTPVQEAGPDLIRDGLQMALRSVGHQSSLVRADMRAAGLLSTAEGLMNLQDTAGEGFDTVLQALATGLHLSHGILWWAPHGQDWQVRATVGRDVPADLYGRSLPEALAARRDLVADGVGAVDLSQSALPGLGMSPCWALRFGSRHVHGGRGLAVLGVGDDVQWHPQRPRDQKLAETLAALASAAAGTLAVREAAKRTSIQAVQALAQAVDAKDHYTHMHSRSVATLAAIIARRMGLSAEQVERARLAGLLHDVGKIGIPDAILNKPGPLNPAETLQMRQHPALGDHITKTIDALKGIAPLVRAHHERWDGRGYPDSLAGEQIPIEARIVSAVDAYDAMTSDRVYRPGRPVQLAAEELLRQRGTQFDPQVVDSLVAYIKERMGPGTPTPAGPPETAA